MRRGAFGVGKINDLPRRENTMKKPASIQIVMLEGRLTLLQDDKPPLTIPEDAKKTVNQLNRWLNSYLTAHVKSGAPKDLGGETP